MLNEGLIGLGIFIGYFLLAGSLTAIFRKILHVPSELVRKMLHLICVMSVVLLLRVFTTWYAAVLAVLAFGAIVYPILVFVERFPLYGRFFAQRKDGEIKTSLILAFLMISLLTTVFWGLLGTSWKYIIIVSVMAWGYGDAAAALIGKTWGRHHIEHRMVEGKKTIEGTIAMFAVSCLAIFITTMIYTAAPWYLCFVIALLVAPVCAVVELFSRRGMDTITVPFSAAISVFMLVSFLLS